MSDPISAEVKRIREEMVRKMGISSEVLGGPSPGSVLATLMDAVAEADPVTYAGLKKIATAFDGLSPKGVMPDIDCDYPGPEPRTFCEELKKI